MSIQTVQPAYILGNSPTAEFRLELLDELTSPQFIEAMNVVPKEKMRVVILGCGSAHLEARLAKLFTGSHFVGVDISSAETSGSKSTSGRVAYN